MKSNIVLTILLFAFWTPLMSFSSWPARDTLILDGDTIYIEKRERVVDLDSLQEKGNEDVAKKKINQHRFSLALDASYNQTVGAFASSYKSLIPLDNFIDREKSHMSNFSPGADIGFTVWRAQLKSAELQLSAHLGFRYNEIKVKTTKLDERVFNKDSLIQLDYIDNRLLLEYFTIFDTTDLGVIGELDTAVVDVRQSVMRYRTWDVPFKICIAYRPLNSKISLYADAGILYRRLSPSNQEKTDLYLVNEQAEFVRFDRTNFRTQHVLSPMFTLGSTYHFIQKDLNEKHWSMSLSATSCMPARTLNPEGYTSVNIRNYMFSFAVRRIF